MPTVHCVEKPWFWEVWLRDLNRSCRKMLPEVTPFGRPFHILQQDLSRRFRNPATLKRLHQVRLRLSARPGSRLKDRPLARGAARRACVWTVKRPPAPGLAGRITVVNCLMKLELRSRSTDLHGRLIFVSLSGDCTGSV